MQFSRTLIVYNAEAAFAHFALRELSVYNSLFKKPLALRDYRVNKVQQLLQKLPVFDIRGNDIILSKRKLLEFLVTPALWNGTVEECLFHQRFKEIIFLHLKSFCELCYKVTGKSNF